VIFPTCFLAISTSFLYDNLLKIFLVLDASYLGTLPSLVTMCTGTKQSSRYVWRPSLSLMPFAHVPTGLVAEIIREDVRQGRS
jgi:hypothetical protein